MKFSRRDFIKVAGAATAVSTFGTPYLALGGTMRVVVVGGGSGGATAAKYIKMTDPNIDVTLVEPNKEYHTCYFSNEVVSGERKLESLRMDYEGLKKRGINVIHEAATGIEGDKKVVVTSSGKRLPFDRCVVSPGVDFVWNAVPGYDEKASEVIPHAWKAGPQTLLLRKQIEAMKDGGTVVIVAPPNPYRCPPGPYERASQIAHYLKHSNKAKSKIIILDPKDKFSKQGQFVQGWKDLYGYGTDNSMITWIGGDKGGKVENVDVKGMTVQCEVESYKGDVINVIPPQKASAIAITAGLADDKGWCPVNMRTFESKKVPGVHVIGDACSASEMPKSAYAANSQAKVCAAAVVALLKGGEAPIPAYVNTCYSLLGQDYGISVAGVYQLAEDGSKIVQVAGGMTPVDASPEVHKREVSYAHSWFKNINADTFG